MRRKVRAVTLNGMENDSREGVMMGCDGRDRSVPSNGMENGSSEDSAEEMARKAQSRGGRPRASTAS